MLLAVVQHVLRSTSAEDLTALVAEVRTASEHGADLVIVPPITSLDVSEVRTAVLEPSPRTAVMAVDGGLGHAGVMELVESPALGRVGVLSHDACFEPSNWESLAARGIEALVLCPGAENELQAEAATEVAIGLSDSLAGLVVIAECTGGEPGEEGHGSSGMVRLGEVIAESFGEEEVLVTPVSVPVPQPEPRNPLPEVPTLLSQRVANHQGRKLQVDYFADLSGSARPH